MGERVILTRLTRKHTYEGVAELSRKISFEAPRGKRVFLEAERARCLRLRDRRFLISGNRLSVRPMYLK